MANFKAPVAPLFNGEQFELNGNVINSKGGVFEFTATRVGNTSGVTFTPSIPEILEAHNAGMPIKAYWSEDGSAKVLAYLGTITPWDETTGQIDIHAFVPSLRPFATDTGGYGSDPDYLTGHPGYIKYYYEYDIDTGADQYEYQRWPQDSSYGFQIKFAPTGEPLPLESDVLTTLNKFIRDISTYGSDTLIPFAYIHQNEGGVLKYPACRLYYIPGVNGNIVEFIGDAVDSVEPGEPKNTPERYRYRLNMSDGTGTIEKIGGGSDDELYIFKIASEAEGWIPVNIKDPTISGYDEFSNINSAINAGKVVVGKYNRGGTQWDVYFVNKDDAGYVFIGDTTVPSQNQKVICNKRIYKMEPAGAGVTPNCSMEVRTIYGRDWKIRYAVGTASTTTDVSVPAPKYATETATPYTFAFVAEDLSDAPIYTGTVDPAPTWDGKWYTDAACTSEATVGTSITKDTTLYCKFI